MKSLARTAAASLLFLIVACGAPTTTSEPTDPSPTTSELQATTTTAPSTITTLAPTTTVAPTSTTTTPTLPEYPTGIDPERIEIPAIGVDAVIVDLLLGSGDPEVPTNFADTGWYTATRDPGEIGPSVIAGHIDSRAGPAVFFRLDELAPGDEIVVHSADGESRTFLVTGAGQYPKTELPREVFAFGDPVPELRLITCGGTFDRSVGHYEDNFVVYAQAG